MREQWAEKNVFMVTGFDSGNRSKLLIGYVIAPDPTTAIGAQKSVRPDFVPTGVVSLEELRTVVFNLEKVCRDEEQALLVEGVRKCHT